jgi:hypothetical protein
MRFAIILFAFYCVASTTASAQTDTSAQATSAQATSGDSEGGLAWRDRPTIEFGDSRVELRARVQSQFVLRDDSAADDEESEDRFSFPRRRFGVAGELLGGRIEFQAERDMANDGVWRDLYVDVRVVRHVRVRVGQFKAPFSREQLTSAFDLDFVARSAAVNDLVPLREAGMMAHGVVASRALRYETGFFERKGHGRFWSPDAARTWAGRVTLMPLRDGSRRGSDLLELAAAWRRSPLAEGRTGSEGSLVMGERFFQPLYAKGSRTLVGASAAVHVPQFTFAGELIRGSDTRAGQAIDGGDLSNLVSRGGYLSGVWHVIHGKGRRRGPAPFREMDVTGRVDWLHFGSANTADEAFRNPRAEHVAPLDKRALTVGVTWHLNRWMRVQTNAVREQFGDPLGLYPVSPTPLWSAVVRTQVVM